jgi:hypothetical protein
VNSVEALDFALQILRNRQRRVAPQPDGSSPTADAIETLDALRDVIADNMALEALREMPDSASFADRVKAADDQHAQQSFWNAYVR